MSQMPERFISVSSEKEALWLSVWRWGKMKDTSKMCVLQYAPYSLQTAFAESGIAKGETEL